MNVELFLPRETAKKVARIGGKIFFEDFSLTAENGECNTPSVMANQRSPDKTILTVWLPRTLFRRLQKFAEKRKETLTELVTSLITHATQAVELSPEDYRRIADETEKAAKRLSASGTRRPTSKVG
jgi:hypothetical protein